MMRLRSPAPVPAMSNVERQRRFQARHPGYDARRKAAERAALKRSSDQRMAAYAERLRAALKAASGEMPPASDAASVAIECGEI